MELWMMERCNSLGFLFDNLPELFKNTEYLSKLFKNIVSIHKILKH